MNGLHMSAYTDGISYIPKELAGTGIGTIQLQLWFQPTNTAHRLLASSTNLEDEYTNSNQDLIIDLQLFCLAWATGGDNTVIG